MFTGIIEKSGRLLGRTPRGPGVRLSIETDLGPLIEGESVAVHGVCLTVASVTASGFEADATAETLDRSTLGSIRVGGGVHLERSLMLGGRLGGHLVSGHVDGKLRLQARDPLGDARRLVLQVQDRALARFIAPKGSVAIDGVSLTVNHVEGDEFDVVVIPHTLAVTALGALSIGDEANLEVDMIARYVARLLAGSAEGAPSPDRDAILMAKLKAAGIA